MINDIALEETVEGVSITDIYKMLSNTPETKLGDFAFPCFKFAKALKRYCIQLLMSRIEEVSNPWIKEAR